MGLLSSFWSSLRFAQIYVHSEAKKSKGSVCIGISTVVTLVVYSSVLFNAMTKVEALFVGLAYNLGSDTDLLLAPGGGEIRLNATKIMEDLQGNPSIKGASARWLVPAKVTPRQNYTTGLDCLMVLVHTEKEQELGFGRLFKHRPLGENELHMSAGMLRGLNVRANRGDRVGLNINLTDILFNTIAPLIENVTDIGSPSGFIVPLLEMAGVDLDQEITINVAGIIESLNLGSLASQAVIPNEAELLAAIEAQTGIPVATLLNGLAPEDRAAVFDSASQQGTDALIQAGFGTVNLTLAQILELPIGSSTALNQSTSVTDFIFSEILDIKTEYTVVDSVDVSGGLYPSALGYVAVVDAGYFLQSIVNNFCPDVYLGLLRRYTSGIAIPETSELLQNLKIDELALAVAVSSANKDDMYRKTTKPRQTDFVDFTNLVFEHIGVNSKTSAFYPVMTSIVTFDYIRLFMNQILFASIFLICGLCCLVVIALMLANSDEKTYDYGMLRALGLPNGRLWTVLMYQASFFSVPGTIIGFVIAFLAGVVLEVVLVGLYEFDLNFTMTVSAVWLPLTLALSVPVFANVVPIRRALSQSLRDSLDIYHMSTNTTMVFITKLEELGLQPWQTAIGILLVVVGFVVYYLVPLTFFFNETSLFFSIMNGILFGLIIGLSMLAQSLEAVVEFFVVKLIVWGPDRRLIDLVHKSMARNRARSSKTHLMFVLSIASVVFGGVVFQLQATTIPKTLQGIFGAQIRVIASNPLLPEALEVDPINVFLEAQQKRNIVDDWCYMSTPLDFMDNIWRTSLTTLAGFPENNLRVVAISDKHLQVAYDQFLAITDLREGDYGETPTGKPDITKALYDVQIQGQQYNPPLLVNNFSDTPDSYSKRYERVIPIILAEAARIPMSASTKTQLQINIKGKGKEVLDKWLAQPVAMVGKFPGLFFSSYQVLLTTTNILVSLDNYELMADAVYQQKFPGTPRPPVGFDSLLVKLNPDLSDDERVDFVNSLRPFIRSDFHTIQDDETNRGLTATYSTATTGAFYVLAALTIALCEFMLLISFRSNVNTNAWEFGVVRSIGLNANACVRLYIYEALCLVISGFCLGTTIGTLTALGLALQFNLFFEFPLEMDYPYALILGILAMAVFAAVWGSWTEASVLKDKKIASVLKDGA